MLAADLPQTRLIALFRPKNAPVLLINTGNRDILTNCTLEHLSQAAPPGDQLAPELKHIEGKKSSSGDFRESTQGHKAAIHINLILHELSSA